MKDNFKETPEFQSINNKLDKAIDNMEVTEIERQLAKLSMGETFPYQIEDSKLFAKKIIKQRRKGRISMGNNMKKLGKAAACLVLTITIGVTAAYATGLFKNFKFYNEKTTVEIRSNQNISEEDAERMAKEAEEDYNCPSTEGITVKSTEKTFSSIKEVEEAVGIDIILPTNIPTDFEMEKDISVYDAFNNNYNIYMTYVSKEQDNRLMGVTIITQNQSEDSTVVTVTDSVYKEEYKTPAGTKYSILEEDGGIIATTDLNNMQYALIFMGVSEEEMHKVIDSVDLSGYIK